VMRWAGVQKRGLSVAITWMDDTLPEIVQTKSKQ